MNYRGAVEHGVLPTWALQCDSRDLRVAGYLNNMSNILKTMHPIRMQLAGLMSDTLSYNLVNE